MRHRQAARRALLAAPAVAISWALLVGLPLVPRAGAPGRLDTDTVVLAGPKASALSPAATVDADRGASRRTTGRATAGWSAAVDLSSGTQMVAMSWTDDRVAAGATVQVRSRRDGTWTAWTADRADPDEGPDTSSGRTGVGPIWLGKDGADRVEVRVTKGSLADLTMMKMRWSDPTPGQARAADAEPNGPTIIPRSQWAPGGWRSDIAGCGSAPKVMNQLRFAAVHHTVNANDYTASQVPGILAGIYRYHTQSLGWCDIGYNFVIDRFGRVWQGRSGDGSLPVMGGHAKGFNTDSMGVAFLGQYQPGASPASSAPTAAALQSLESLLAWKLSIHGIDPRGTVSVLSQGSTKYPAGQRVTIPTIIGHRDVGLTSCPGDKLFVQLPAVRNAVAWIIAASATPTKWAPFTNPRSLAARQYVDFLGRPSTNTDQARWASAMQRGRVAPARMIGTLVASSELKSRSEPVARLYLAYFRRVPDHAGLAYWLARSRSGTPLSSISAFFAASSEFERSYGSLSNSEFVDRVYRNVLGRAPDEAGRTYWTDQLDRGALSRGAVMTGFSESSENKRSTLAEVEVILTYDAMLGRTISSASLFKWVPLVQGGSITDLIDQAFHSPEYANRIRG